MKYKYCICLLFLSFLIVTTSCSQVFSYKSVDNLPSYIAQYNRQVATNKLKKQHSFVSALKYLPVNYVKDGSVDYSDNIQRALNENRYVLMPNFPILINDKGLFMNNNQNVLFDVNSKIILKPTSKSNYQIINIVNKNNVVLYSPNIFGDRKKHIGVTGEWGMGINIISSSNVTIINSNISNCWGDGIYIGQKNGISCKDIIINYGTIDNCRRNGISVVSVEGFTLKNIVISNTNGTNPQSGIDFEPNQTVEHLKDVSINNCYLFNNKRYGVFVCNNRLLGVDKEINLNIENVSISKSQGGIGYISNGSKLLSNRKLNGILQFKNVTTKDVKNKYNNLGRSVNDKVQIKFD